MPDLSGVCSTGVDARVTGAEPVCVVDTATEVRGGWVLATLEHPSHPAALSSGMDPGAARPCLWRYGSTGDGIVEQVEILLVVAQGVLDVVYIIT
jgi:hypothetical protein